MTRVAAIDCGTNSLRLLVVDRQPGAPVVEVLRRSEVVRLGEGVDRTGWLSDAALERARACCAEYARECAGLGVRRVRFAATSATRDAANGGAFVALVERELASWGVRPEVLTGEQEAHLTFVGAAGAVRDAGLPGPYLVVDLGGGSTELVRGSTEVQAACSVDLGAVRLHERLGLGVPPDAAQVACLDGVVAPALDAAFARVPLGGVQAVVGVAGTATTVAAYGLGLSAYRSDAVHLSRTTPREAATDARRLAALPEAGRRLIPGVVQGRVDVIGAGALLWAAILERADAAGVSHLVVSEHDILDGLAASVIMRD